MKIKDGWNSNKKGIAEEEIDDYFIPYPKDIKPKKQKEKSSSDDKTETVTISGYETSDTVMKAAAQKQIVNEKSNHETSDTVVKAAAQKQIVNEKSHGETSDTVVKAAAQKQIVNEKSNHETSNTVMRAAAQKQIVNEKSHGETSDTIVKAASQKQGVYANSYHKASEEKRFKKENKKDALVDANLDYNSQFAERKRNTKKSTNSGRNAFVNDNEHNAAAVKGEKAGVWNSKANIASNNSGNKSARVIGNRVSSVKGDKSSAWNKNGANKASSAKGGNAAQISIGVAKDVTSKVVNGAKQTITEIKDKSLKVSDLAKAKQIENEGIEQQINKFAKQTFDTYRKVFNVIKGGVDTVKGIAATVTTVFGGGPVGGIIVSFLISFVFLCFAFFLVIESAFGGSDSEFVIKKYLHDNTLLGRILIDENDIVSNINQYAASEEYDFWTDVNKRIYEQGKKTSDVRKYQKVNDEPLEAVDEYDASKMSVKNDVILKYLFDYATDHLTDEEKDMLRDENGHLDVNKVLNKIYLSNYYIEALVTTDSNKLLLRGALQDTIWHDVEMGYEDSKLYYANTIYITDFKYWMERRIYNLEHPTEDDMDGGFWN